MIGPVDETAIGEHVAFLAQRWDDLLELRQPGTPRPWRQALLDPERRAEQARRDRAEREVRDPDAPGFTSAPQHVEILDLIVDGWVLLDELAAAVRPHGPTRPPAYVRRLTEIDDLVAYIELWLPVVAASPAAEPDRILRIGRRLTRLIGDIARAVGLVIAGQLLAGAVCPFCKGVTPKHPAGAAITLRVEEIAPSKTATTLRPAVEAVHAVVCWNPLCDPDSEHCGTRYRGRPAWPWHEWEWLAPQLIIAEPEPSRPRPAASRPAGFSDVPVVPIDHAGRVGVDRKLPAGPHTAAALAGARTEQRPGADRGTRVRFGGGPFDGQTRSFVRLDDILAVTQPAGLRPQLGDAYAAALTRVAAAFGRANPAQASVLGAYRLVRPSSESAPPRYVWHVAGPRTGARADDTPGVAVRRDRSAIVHS